MLAMTVRPLAAPDSSFSESILYRFRLRPLAIAAERAGFTFGPEESEVAFTFAFDAPQPGADGARPVQTGRCTSTSGEPVRLQVDDDAGGRLDTMRVYAGLRSDPFFIDLPAFLESIATGRLAFKQPSRNFATDFNALSVVVEVDCATLLERGGSLFGVVGETVVAGQVPVRLERVGRPEI